MNIDEARTFADGIHELLSSVDSERLANRTLELVEIPSNSGAEADVAERYASYFREIGLDVVIDDEFPESPSVIARVQGNRAPERTLQFAGHLDTVSNPHSPPLRDSEFVRGRGSCDMKGGLAVMCEIAQLIVEADIKLPGALLFSAHGQHEESVSGRPLHAPLTGLLQRKIVGDACLIPEGPHTTVPSSGMGLVIFECLFRREGEPVHEVLGGIPPHRNPIMGASAFIEALTERSAHWSLQDPSDGGESFFVGSFHGGDLYNRVPSWTKMSGTRRYPVGRDFKEVKEELVEAADRAARRFDLDVDISVERSGQPFRLPDTEPIVTSLQKAYESVTGIALNRSGMNYTGDASHFINLAGVPAVYHGTNQSTAHSDAESVALSDLTRCTRVLLSTVARYFVNSADRATT